MRGVFLRRGQSLADLALIIGVLGLVFVGMEVYIKRGVQGKAKDLTDYIVSDQQSITQSGEAEEIRNSNLTLDSSMTSRGFQGGSRNLTGTESSFYEYETQSSQ